MIQGVYSIKCLVTNKVYVGSSVSIEFRWKKHKQALDAKIHHSILLQRAWDKYGADKFEFSIIEKVGDEIYLLSREQYWLDVLKATNPDYGYNLCKNAGSCLGVRRSVESRLRMSEAHVGVSLSQNHRTAIGVSRQGEKSCTTNLTDADVCTIRSRLTVGENHRKLIVEYGLTRKIMYDLIHGETWKHLKLDFSFYSFTTSGSNHYNAKLDEDDVIYIKGRLLQGEKKAVLARFFNVGYSTIDDIDKGRTWRSI